MTPIPLTPETEALARRLIWFEEPTEALADPVRFVAYALERGTHEDMTVLRRYVSEGDLGEALDNAPAGIIGARSWAYWQARMGCVPPPPLPKRALGEARDRRAGADIDGGGRQPPGRAGKRSVSCAR